MTRALALTFALLLFPQQSQPTQQPTQSVPDAPAPQQQDSNPLPDLKNQVAPGKSTTPDSNNDSGSPNVVQAPPAPPAATPPQQEAPDLPPPGTYASNPIRVTVNYVEVPVTVRDKHNQLVAGLTWHDFRIFEDGQPQNIRVFSADPMPLSVAFVIDQSVPRDTMEKVNQSMAAFTGALTPSDEVAVFTYSNGPEKQTDYTAAQGNRLPQVLARAQTHGRDMGVPVNSGPLAINGPVINGQSADPNLSRGGASAGGFITVPREIHTLNDAMLAAAQSLSARPKDRRRVIFVISDGKEYGSKATVKQVITYLNTNKIQVFGTLVGDSATWGLGYLDKIHLPLLPASNILPKYTVATGGSLDSEFSTNGIERSYLKLMESVRNQYTLGYFSHGQIIAGKRHDIDVRLPGRPGYEVQAKLFYYTSAADK